MPLVWRGSELLRCNKESLSAELVCNLGTKVWTWRGKGKGASTPTVASCLSDAMCTSVELQRIFCINI